MIQRDMERVIPELLPLHHREAVITASAPTDGWNGTWPPAPWAPEFQVTDAEAREVLSRLRAHPVPRARIEGMVRVQGNQYGVMMVIRDRAMETLAAVDAAAAEH